MHGMSVCMWSCVSQLVTGRSSFSSQLNPKIVIFSKRIRKECSWCNVSAVISFFSEQL